MQFFLDGRGLKFCVLIAQIYVDLHGHSRMKDIFVYGCDPHLSWKASDATDYLGFTPGGSDDCFLELAEVMHNISLPFSKVASE